MMILQFVVLQVLVFGAIIFFLRKLLYGKTESEVNRLGDTYHEILSKQQEMEGKIQEAEKEYSQKLEEAQKLADKLQADMTQEMQDKENEILKKARQEADEIIAKANAAQDEIRKELEVKYTRMSADSAKLILREIMTAEIIKILHNELIRDFLKKSSDLDTSHLDVAKDAVTVRTAMPLNPEQIDSINKLLLDKFNQKIEFEQVEDAELVAGIILQFGTLRLDACFSTMIDEGAEKRKEEAGK